MTKREQDVLDTMRRLEAVAGRGVTLAAVAAELRISAPTVHEHAQGLLRAGLVEKRPDGGYGALPRCPTCLRAWELPREIERRAKEPLAP